MGANGAGKSTLVKMLTGVLRPDSGTITMRGALQRFPSPNAARRAGLISVYQDPALVPDLTIAQNLRLSRIAVEKVRPLLAEFGLAALDLRCPARELAM